MEILIPSVINREVSDLENAGTVNLQLREVKKPLDSDEECKTNKKG